MIDEEGRNYTVAADGRSDTAVPLCSERASDAHLTTVTRISIISFLDLSCSIFLISL